MKPLEMWGGLECTLNRVGDRFIDQCEKNDHQRRASDLKLFADLGLKKLRYPCLWEQVAPETLDHCDWSYLDERLHTLRALNLPFIAGFLHHGSGPKYTSLIDREFPEKFAAYAEKFIQRYPWVEDFTPINEINTTARFSCLYGHWYPHQKDDHHYLKALVNQCRATVLAMAKIREVNPSARLIQTDDFGRCQSTEVLKYQSDFENERRWLSFDLLCGKIDREHPLYHYLIQAGISDQDIEWFTQNTCPPDVIGLNHYPLSNRFLDHRLELYPEWLHGGNGQHAYADVGAVDTGQASVPTPESLFREVWERYKRPMAVTECHIRGPREAQMRWLDEIWKTAQKLHGEGIEFEAVTVWSLLGTYDWHTLCTKCEDFYEPGVFDLRNPRKEPRETALSQMVRALATSGSFHSPVLVSEGTWKTPRRILWGSKTGDFTRLYHHSEARPILIAGATGTLGQALARTCGARNIYYRILSRKEMDLSNIHSIEEAVETYKPWAIINAAGYVKVDEAEKDQVNCFKGNVQGAINLAKICKDRGIRLINYSSDLVFDGTTSSPYLESHQVSPMNVYGQSKAECEEQVLKIYPDSLMIRTSAFFSPWDNFNFVTLTLRALAQKTEVVAANDSIVSPTYVPDLAHESLNLLLDGEKGIVHLANQGQISWEGFAKLAAQTGQEKYPFPLNLIRGAAFSDLKLAARRPRNSALGSEKHTLLPPLEDAVNRYFQDLQVPISHQEMP